MRNESMAIAVCLLAAAASAAALQEIDLASDTAWTIRADTGSSLPVIVPGKGWNSDIQPQRLARRRNPFDSVVYERSITIPPDAENNVVKLLLGAVNYGGDVYIDNELLGSHRNLFLPFEIDLTGKVTPGKTHALKVATYSSKHYGNRIPLGCYWSSLSYGITRYVKLVVLPQVYIKDIFVKPSVTRTCLDIDVWVHNASPQNTTATLNAALTSWNNAPWSYPSVPPRRVVLERGAVTKISIGPVPWRLGPESYWWPNVPFREDYTAQLHNLLLSIEGKAAVLDTAHRRFGFVEHGEGPYYYTVNGVRIGFAASDGTPEQQYGYDAYSTADAFLPPSGPGTGCPESWRRFMRLGISTNRTHSSIPTEYMMEAADEVGFMLIPESAIRGFEQAGVWDSATYTNDVRGMAAVCRNHPSVVRYSIENEYNDSDYVLAERMLIDAAVEVDDTRPLVIENGGYPQRVQSAGGHAYYMCHYADYRNWPTRLLISGLGEYAHRDWLPNHAGNGDLMREGDLGKEMRKRDVAYFAIWDVYNYWPNLLQGMTNTRRRGSRNRKDGVNGWGSEEIDFLQRCLHPYLVADSMVDEDNLAYTPGWPTTVPEYSEGTTVTRRVYVFNNGLFGNSMGLLWEARWDSATGLVAASGAIEKMTIEPGFYTIRPVSFAVPGNSAGVDTVATGDGGTVMYVEDRVYFTVGDRKLYLVMKSVPYPALRRFGTGADTVRLGEPDPVSHEIAVGFALSAPPQIKVLDKPSWLKASVTGKGTDQGLRVSLKKRSLKSGIHQGAVRFAAEGFAPETLTVVARVQGKPRAKGLRVVPSHAGVLPGSATRLRVVAVDQFGDSIDAPVEWSVSSGGTIGADGVFHAGESEGRFAVCARIRGRGGLVDSGVVEVSRGVPVPDGWLSEMLCLQDPFHSPYIMFLDIADKIEKHLADPSANPPAEGSRIVVGNPITKRPLNLTWARRECDDGVWADIASKDCFVSYWSVTILCSSDRKARLVTRHDGGMRVWKNGVKILDHPRASDGETSSEMIDLDAGATVFVFALSDTGGKNEFAVKVVDEDGGALPDLRLVPQSRKAP